MRRNSPMPVAAMWDDFAREVLPAGAPFDQVREMRRASYAGAWAMLTETRRICEDGSLEEDRAIVLRSVIELELKAFRVSVRHGRGG